MSGHLEFILLHVLRVSHNTKLQDSASKAYNTNNNTRELTYNKLHGTVCNFGHKVSYSLTGKYSILFKYIQTKSFAEISLY